MKGSILGNIEKGLGIILIIAGLIIAAYALIFSMQFLVIASFCVGLMGVLFTYSGNRGESSIKQVPKHRAVRSWKLIVIFVMLVILIIFPTYLMINNLNYTKSKMIYLPLTIVVFVFAIINGLYGIKKGKCYTGSMSDNWYNIISITTDPNEAKKIGKRSLITGILIVILYSLIFLFG